MATDDLSDIFGATPLPADAGLTRDRAAAEAYTETCPKCGGYPVMIDLFIAVDMETKYQKWLAVDEAARRLDGTALRYIFRSLYQTFATTLLFEYETRSS